MARLPMISVAGFLDGLDRQTAMGSRTAGMPGLRWRPSTRKSAMTPTAESMRTGRTTAQETPMQKVGQGGVWQNKLKLPAGKYRYRLVVDGQWQHDPYNETVETNPFGEYNSVLNVH